MFALSKSEDMREIQFIVLRDGNEEPIAKKILQLSLKKLVSSEEGLVHALDLAGTRSRRHLNPNENSSQ